MADDDIWRRRFALFSLIRLIGVATFLLGVTIAFSDLVRTGGWPLLGGIIAIAGVIDAVVAPKLLTRHWKNEDRSRG